MRLLQDVKKDALALADMKELCKNVVNKCVDFIKNNTHEHNFEDMTKKLARLRMIQKQLSLKSLSRDHIVLISEYLVRKKVHTFREFQEELERDDKRLKEIFPRVKEQLRLFPSILKDLSDLIEELSFSLSIDMLTHEVEKQKNLLEELEEIYHEMGR